MLSNRLERSQVEAFLVFVGSLLLLAAITVLDEEARFIAAVVGAVFNTTALFLTFWPERSEEGPDEDYGNLAEDGKISITQTEPPAPELFPDELQEAAEIDWDALCEEIGRTRKDYELPTTPDGEDGPWLDKLEICHDVARHVRDGGSIDTDRVIES